MFQYKNVSGQTQVLVGFGEIKPDQIFKTKVKVENPNFELVTEEGGAPRQPKQTTVKSEQPAGKNTQEDK